MRHDLTPTSSEIRGMEGMLPMGNKLDGEGSCLKYFRGSDLTL